MAAKVSRPSLAVRYENYIFPDVLSAETRAYQVALVASLMNWEISATYCSDGSLHWVTLVWNDDLDTQTIIQVDAMFGDVRTGIVAYEQEVLEIIQEHQYRFCYIS